MKITFLGAAHEVTGSCHLVSCAGRHFLVDCGMEQGADLYENQELPVHASDIDFVLLTHAHIDHSGLLPLLYARGFRGAIYATEATRKLCNIMLKDSAHIQEQETDWKNRKAQRSGRPLAEPIYTVADAEGALSLFVPCAYQHRYEICEDIAVRFADAGHLLGSASIEVWLREGETRRKVVFSGDLGNPGRPLIRDPSRVEEADYVLVESTYADRDHEVPASDFQSLLAEVISDTLRRGGNVVIPAFSVGRTQELLYYIRRILEAGQIDGELADFEVYMDSPMAVEATTVFGQSERDCYDEEALSLVERGINPIGFLQLRTAVTAEESKAINFNKKPKVILSASGMCEAGRIRHHLKHNLWRPESTVVFVGYQCEGTLGRRLLDGAETAKLFGEEVQVRARIVNLPGISGHADRTRLLAWVRDFSNPVTRYFVVHGEDQICDGFARLIEAETGRTACAPYSGESWDLDTDTRLSEGNRERKQISKKETQGTQTSVSAQDSQTEGKRNPAAKKPRDARAAAVYDRLVAAGERLRAVIRRNEGGTNKDLARFADQIQSLCDRWDR